MTISEWKVNYDAWVNTEDGMFVRWSAIELLEVAPARPGWDIVARLSRGGVVLGHADSKEEAEAKMRALIGRLSGDFRA